jgi:SRSO17 transposase
VCHCHRSSIRWIADDTVNGIGDIERDQDLRRAGKGYVLGVGASHVFRSWGAEALEASDWVRLSAGLGTEGPRLHDWCYLELADLEAEEFNDDIHGAKHGPCRSHEVAEQRIRTRS